MVQGLLLDLGERHKRPISLWACNEGDEQQTVSGTGIIKDAGRTKMETDYIILTDRHGDTRQLLARGGGEWVLDQTEHIGWRTNDDGTIQALDAPGGPFIGVGAQIRSATGQLLTVSRIVRTPEGQFILTMSD